jgi:S-sulfosulfanyl-L-cysteine sulfohydrolase
MMPVDSQLKSGIVTGEQIVEWLERELENALAKDPTKRFGGWFVRFSGLQVTFTIANAIGSRVQRVAVQGEPLVRDKTYSVLGCEREGDMENVVCRIPRVADARRRDASVHDVLTEYLAAHSPVAPVVDGRATATDAPADLLSQVEGTPYRFR